jgi:hypothetical protein
MSAQLARSFSQYEAVQQELLAFQLTLAFTSRFAMLDGFELVVYVTSLIVDAGAAALLIAPAAFHRIVFQRHLKGELVRAASRFWILCWVCGRRWV